MTPTKPLPQPASMQRRPLPACSGEGPSSLPRNAHLIPCKFFNRGYCQDGEVCPFLHEERWACTRCQQAQSLQHHALQRDLQLVCGSCRLPGGLQGCQACTLRGQVATSCGCSAAVLPLQIAFCTTGGLVCTFSYKSGLRHYMVCKLVSLPSQMAACHTVSSRCHAGVVEPALPVPACGCLAWAVQKFSRQQCCVCCRSNGYRKDVGYNSPPQRYPPPFAHKPVPAKRFVLAMLHAVEGLQVLHSLGHCLVPMAQVEATLMFRMWQSKAGPA